MYFRLIAAGPIMSIFELPTNLSEAEGRSFLLDELKLSFLTSVSINPKMSKLSDEIKVRDNFQFLAGSSRSFVTRKSIEQEFEFKCLMELDKIYLLIQKASGGESDQKNASINLICPNVSCVEYISILETKIKLVEAKYMDLKYIYPNYAFFRLKAESGEYYVAKVLFLRDTDSDPINPLFLFLNELNLHKKYLQLSRPSPYLIHMVNLTVEYELSNPAKNPTFYMLYKDFHASLRDIIEYRRQVKAPFTESQVVEILRDLTFGLKALHGLDIAHRNLRPETIFFNMNSNRFLIGGLSLASVVDSDDFSFSPCLIGSPFYMSIDFFTDFQIKKKRIHFVTRQLKNDIYSIGVIMCELLVNALGRVNLGYTRPLYGFMKAKKLQDVADLIKLSEEKLSLHNFLLEVVQ